MIVPGPPAVNVVDPPHRIEVQVDGHSYGVDVVPGAEIGAADADEFCCEMCHVRMMAWSERAVEGRKGVSRSQHSMDRA